MDTPKINHISLCAGYGGIDIGLRRILPSLRNLAYCEIEVFPLTNLVSKIESGQLDEAPIFTNLKTFNAKPFRGLVDILSGGFPCQPFSSAGNKKSTDDPRHLFPEIERIILECEPRIIFLENVEGIISSKLGGEENTSVLKYVLESLEKMDYRATAGLFSAEEISAPHRRKRIFIAGVRNSDNNGESTLPLNDETSGMPQHSELSNTQSCGCGRRTMQTERKWGESQREGCEMGGKTTRCHCSSGKERLGNTEHDGPLATGNIEESQGESNRETSKVFQSTGTTTRDCFPARPNEPQHGWEYPRTIGDEAFISTLDGSVDGAASSDVVHADRINRFRIDALRLAGNGVVPATAAKAFVCLMNELSTSYPPPHAPKTHDLTN